MSHRGSYASYEPQPAQRRDAVSALRVRLARADDRNAIAALIAERHDQDPAEVAPRVAKELAFTTPLGHDNQLFVAEADGRVLGFGRTAHVRPGVHGQPACFPQGWFLMGVIVAPDGRRRGIGRALGQCRLDWIGERASEAFTFANRENQASRALMEALGFEPLPLVFAHERAKLAEGEGVLYRAALL